MVRVSVTYPRSPGSTFDWDYYLGPHLALAHRLLDPMGLIRIEVDRGIGAFPPGTASHVHAVGHLFFASIEEMESAMAAHAAEFVTDQGKYFNGESIVQVNEVVDAKGSVIMPS
jgi:uncharacterized protein (TIGR02118 family)